MFTIQYIDVTGASRMQEFDSRARSRLVMYLTTFNRPIAAVYEQATPITKAVQKDLREWPGSLSREAKEFAHNGEPLTYRP